MPRKHPHPDLLARLLIGEPLAGIVGHAGRTLVPDPDVDLPALAVEFRFRDERAGTEAGVDVVEGAGDGSEHGFEGNACEGE